MKVFVCATHYLSIYLSMYLSVCSFFSCLFVYLMYFWMINSCFLFFLSLHSRFFFSFVCLCLPTTGLNNSWIFLQESKTCVSYIYIHTYSSCAKLDGITRVILLCVFFFSLAFSFVLSEKKNDGNFKHKQQFVVVVSINLVALFSHIRPNKCDEFTFFPSLSLFVRSRYLSVCFSFFLHLSS